LTIGDDSGSLQRVANSPGSTIKWGCPFVVSPVVVGGVSIGRHFEFVGDPRMPSGLRCMDVERDVIALKVYSALHLVKDARMC
jgi:hypothetical protein